MPISRFRKTPSSDRANSIWKGLEAMPDLDTATDDYIYQNEIDLLDFEDWEMINRIWFWEEESENE
jgi:hypothetical protein